VPVGAAEAPPSPLFFERVRGVSARTRLSLVVAADSSVSSKAKDVFAAGGARLHTSPAPRGRRLAEAVVSLPFEESSLPPLLLFLHADTLLPVAWDEEIGAALARGATGGAFRLGYDGGGWRMAWVAAWANVRTAWTRVPYGDQAPWVKRDVYDRLGGHAPWPFLEDWDFSRRLVAAEGRNRIEILRGRVRTSPRRYLERGVGRTVMLNWEILRKARGGESPEQLAELYRR